MMPTEQVAADHYQSEGWHVIHGGAPDFLLVRETAKGTVEVAFAEVKGGQDTLSRDQRVWRLALAALGLRYDVARVHGTNVIIRTPHSTNIAQLDDGRYLIVSTVETPRSAVPITVQRVPSERSRDSATPAGPSVPSARGPLAELTCPHCGATWRPRKASVLKCPRCWLPLQQVGGTER